MQKTRLVALATIWALVLAGCSGQHVTPQIASTTTTQNGAKHAMSTPACAPAWQSGGTYSAGQVVSYDAGGGTHNYTALVNQTDYAGTGWNPTVGSLYSDNGACGGSSTATPSPTPSPTPTTTATATPTATPTTTASPTPTPTATATGSGPACWAAWNASTAYTGGAHVSYNGENYQAAYWTQGDEPDTHSGPAGSGAQWIPEGSCGSGGGSTPTPTPTPTATATATATASPTPTPTATPTSGGGGGGTAPGFIFSPFKDITVGMNWNTSEMMSFGQKTYAAMPSGVPTMDWAFASGTCGSENWGGVTPSALVNANVQAWVNAGKDYIVSTGGSAANFLCPTTSGFLSFIQTYISKNMIGVDFDIEYSQTQSEIDALVADVKAAEASYPNLRFSFTVPTLGGTTGLPSGGFGDMVMQSIKRQGLGGNYTIDLMTMDYGSPSSGNCVLVNGQCEMGQSAVQAAEDLHDQYGAPYSQIEVCPLIGANDTAGENFTVSDADTVANFVKQDGLAGLHFWSFDRDNNLSYSDEFINDGI